MTGDSMASDVLYAFNVLYTTDWPVRWFALKREARTAGIALTAGKLWDAALMSRRGWNVYVQLNPTYRDFVGGRAAVRNISHLRFIMLDFDPVGDEKWQAVWERAKRAVDQLRKLLDIPAYTPVTIHSGRGVQLWCELEDPIPLEDRALTGARLKSFLRRFDGIDMAGCSDLARVARLPGSINQKTGKPATLVTSGTGPEPRLRRLIEEQPVDSLVGAMPVGDWVDCLSGASGERSWRDVFVTLTASAQNYILRGVSHGGRHNAAWHTVRLLHERGVSRASAEAAITHGGILSTPSSSVDPEFAAYLTRVLHETYGPRLDAPAQA